MEKQFIFHPESRIDQSPRDIGLQFGDVFFMASDGVRLNRLVRALSGRARHTAMVSWQCRQYQSPAGKY
jgi:hypothetical protein